MSRPLRIEFPGAVHHVTSRGNAGRQIFTDAADGGRFVELLEREIGQQRWLCHAFCLMGDHYHLLVETPEANLARGMGRLNMTYAQWFNRRHGSSGHLFGDRYRTVNVEPGEAMLLLARHVVLNPVRRNLVRFARQWRWSSYQATAFGTGPGWACGEAVLAGFAAEDGETEGAEPQLLTGVATVTARLLGDMNPAPQRRRAGRRGQFDEVALADAEAFRRRRGHGNAAARAVQFILVGELYRDRDSPGAHAAAFGFGRDRVHGAGVVQHDTVTVPDAFHIQITQIDIAPDAFRVALQGIAVAATAGRLHSYDIPLQ